MTTRRGVIAASLPAAAATALVLRGDGEQAAATLGVGTYRFLEDFGAKGDFDPATGTGTDDTAAIQGAIDWAYGDGKQAPGAIMVAARNYLCGQVRTHPYTTIIGTGRHTSAFWCRTGTTGKWWSDAGAGAQKLMLSGLAWYGRDERGLTYIAEFGGEGIQFGTEGILDGLWLRGAPNATALSVNGNVGIVSDITVQDAAIGLAILGNGNQVQNIISMQMSRIGADLHGSFVRGLHLEAIDSGGLPLRMAGDCRVHDVFVSSASGTRFDHLFAVDDAAYDEWTLDNVHIIARDSVVERGIVKVGQRYTGGTNQARFTGANLLASVDVHRGELALAGQRFSAFAVELSAAGGTLRHRIGALGDVAAKAAYAEAIASASPGFSTTPVSARDGGGFAKGARIDRRDGSCLLLDLRGSGGAERQTCQAVIQRNTTGRVLTCRTSVMPDGSANGSGRMLGIAFFDAASGEPFDLSAMADGLIEIGLSGFLG